MSDQTDERRRVPIAEGLFAESPEPHLLGSRCASCGARTFPQQSSCPRCSSLDVEVVPLSRRGTLWTWTSQDFLPKSPPYAGPEDPTTFRPWLVGYAELDDGLVVEGRLSGFENRQPVIGEELEVTIVPFTTDEEGNDVMLYAFSPVSGGAHDE
jgi:uncharacterized OB-fold protein